MISPLQANMHCSLLPSCSRLPCPSPVTARRTSCIVRSTESGVSELLARDRRLTGAPQAVVPELESAPGPPPDTVSKQREADQVVKTRKQRQESMSAKAAARADPDRPKTCKQAIDKGLEMFQDKKFQEAIDLFNMALELPGNGAYRLPDSPREYSCPSDAEENAALYNMACAYAQMGRKSSALTCIEAILENGFDDFETIRKDPDLAPARTGQELNLLLFKFENPVAKVAVNLPFGLGPKKPVQSDGTKPWILW